ncbi:undecaprenyl-diphosphate phosphatase [Pseudoxanthomonas winnipegensis]|uniref:Undecaprenyl-diphosphatase n=1 Tax=Pseudoxanthomonas winnipegensis TaxID=2480810 RepID=A0A4Q8L587_9GAMM|nr:undecaprenyl-diphosphate phosphatase [Pseudoxanthomonas winnipegensis]PZP60145.1 MAG: undecaprenyl-diphosphate phosphatase [Pseudoxanthomonas spadix]TAA21372.1 undecaprenyl-diphosphate phosphatase [Pseudoxanthomonas winnipegensis]
MSELLAALLLGILEGLTEFLPISSTGHLLIAQHWLPRQTDFFNIIIQAGAIIAVVLVFRQRLVSLALGWRDPVQRDYLFKLGTAFLVTAVVGLVVRKLGWALPETVTPVAWALIIGGIWMIVAERLAERRGDNPNVTWTVAVLVGLAQVVAGVFPGTSRSAAAIFIAMLAGTSRRASATEFAFLVGIPTMFAASGYTFLELAKDGQLGQVDWTAVAVAFLAAAVTGFIVVRWLLGFIKSHRYTGFAVYRIVLGVALLLFLPGGA